MGTVNVGESAMDRNELFQVLFEGFSLEELKALCFDLAVKSEDLEGNTLGAKVIELIGYFERRGDLARLEQACRKAQANRFPSLVEPAVYSSNIEFAFDSVSAALAAIETLSLPETWARLTVERPLCNEGWMGSNSDQLIDILYALYRPIVVHQLLRRDIERNFSMLDWRKRLQFILLEFAKEIILHDAKIAALRPAISYTPRVPGWRRLREENPQKYWWQGLSHDKLEDALKAFCKDAGGRLRLLSLEEFRQYYHSVFGSRNEKEQQAIGLAANALYGFTPRARPVYWRLLVLQSRLYRGSLNCRSHSFRRPTSPEEVLAALGSNGAAAFPSGAVPGDVEAFEPFATTVQATTDFLSTIVVPQVLLKLNATEYGENKT
jgi:hypothetical protein